MNPASAILAILAAAFMSAVSLLPGSATARSQAALSLNSLSTQTTAPTQFCYNWSTNLRYGDKGPDVEALATALRLEGFSLPDYATSGMNERAPEFGDFLASNVVAFQEKYNSEILKPYLISRGTGYVGQATRAKLNALYGCGGASSQKPQNPAPTYTNKPTTPSASSICYVFSRDLGIGSTGADVVSLQAWLIAKGYNIRSLSSGYAAKGFFGTQTLAALRQYQASVGVSESSFGPLTRAKVNAACSVKNTPPAKPADPVKPADPAKPSDPIVCPAIYAPVCGADAKTYSNSCVAKSAGVTSYKEGACPAQTSIPAPVDPTNSTKPVISSITPTTMSVGTAVEVRGKNLTGYEGDNDLWIKNVRTGQTAVIHGGTSSTGELIRFVLADKYCSRNTAYVGVECGTASGFEYVYITPDTYYIYALPWGVESNRTMITVTAANQSVPTITSVRQTPESIGQVVTIFGSGLRDAKVLLNGAEYDISVQKVSGYDSDQALAFTVPEYLNPPCPAGSYCAQYIGVSSIGKHKLSVKAQDGRRSNELDLEIVSDMR